MFSIGKMRLLNPTGRHCEEPKAPKQSSQYRREWIASASPRNDGTEILRQAGAKRSNLVFANCVLLIILSLPSFAKISTSVSPESPIYNAFDQFEVWGCAQPTIRTLRPQSYSDLRDSLALKGGVDTCQAPEWLLRERELWTIPLQPGHARAEVFLSPDDRVRLVPLDASVTPSAPFRSGRPQWTGPNLLTELQLNTEAGQEWGIAAGATAGWVGALENSSHFLGRFYVNESYIKAGYRRVEVLYGYVSMAFGDARHGNLFLSPANRPLDMWRLTLRPGASGTFANFTVSTWFAKELWGADMAFRPIPAIELGLFLASQRTTTNPARGEFYGALLNGWLPSKFAKLYTQLFFREWFSPDTSFLFGAWLPKLGRAGLRIEYVRTSRSSYLDPSSPQLLVYRETFLGHPVGPVGEGLYVNFTLPPLALWRPEIQLAYEGRNRTHEAGLPTEWRTALSLTVARRWIQTELFTSVQYALVSNQQYRYLGNSHNLSALGWVKYSFF